MKKLLGLVILAVLLSSCIVKSAEVPNYTVTAIPDLAGTPDLAQEPPKDRTWISPGKVNISNYYPGATAEQNVIVHNGKPQQANFKVTYREPAYTADGYAKPMLSTQDWIVIADMTPVLAPFETRNILVTLKMPTGIKGYPPKWEYWISVIDGSQAGSVNTELCSRFLVNMR